MAWTNDWAPGEGVWMTQKAQVQVIHMCFTGDVKAWTLGPPSPGSLRTSLWRGECLLEEGYSQRKNAVQLETLIISWVSQLFSCIWLLVFLKVLWLVLQRICQKYFWCFIGQTVTQPETKKSLVIVNEYVAGYTNFASLKNLSYFRDPFQYMWTEVP